MKPHDWLAPLRRPVRRRPQTSGTNCESLEAKALLSVTTSFNAGTGLLEVSSDANDAIVISPTETGDDVLVNGGSTGVQPADVVTLKVVGGPVGNLLSVSAVSDQFFSNLVDVSVSGGGGNDTIIGSDFDDELVGGAGHDQIDGGGGDDFLKGEGGDDTLRGGPGADSLAGHTGGDELEGGDGNDTLAAGGHNDIVRGGADNDIIRAGSGQDQADGGSGDDDLIGGAGRDTLDGSAGDDTLRGQNGSDYLSGGAGPDVIRGNKGKDRLAGDEGADDLRGGSSDDLLKGGDDNDTLDGGRGDDLLDGDDGEDTETNGHSTDLESTFLAPLSNVGNATGEATFEHDVDGDIELEFEVEVSGAAPGTHNIHVDGVIVGQILIESSGEGLAQFSTEPDDAGELQLPANFPAITAGSTITVSDVGGTFLRYQDKDMSAVLAPIGASFGEGLAEFEADGPVRHFRLTIDNVAAGTYDLIIDGVVVDSISVSGTTVIEYDDENPEIAFPQNFPDLTAGMTIEVQGELSGQF